MVGAQFVNIGGTTKDINDLFAQNTLPGLDDNYAFQTTLLSWTGTGYRTYGWYADGDGSDPEMDWPEADAKWILNNQSDIAEVDIPAGVGFWIRIPQESQGGSLTMFGEVPADTIAPVQITGNEFTMIANPTPKAIDIQKIKPSASIPGLDENYAFQTTILLWTGTGYRTYGWYADGDGSDPEMDWPEADAKWILNNQSDIADVSIPAGTAFWFRTTPGTTGTVTFAE